MINGKSWSTASTDQADESGTGYILIRTDGDPLNKAQKLELKALGVQIHEFVGGVVGGGADCCEDDDGDEDHQQQIYLCGYPKGNSFEPLRALDYIDYADEYSSDLVIHVAVERLRARPVVHRSNSTGTPKTSGGGPSYSIAASNGIVASRVSNNSGLIHARTAPAPVFHHQAVNNPVHADAVDETVEVDVLLHHDIGPVPQELIDRICAVEGTKKLTTDDESGIVRLEIHPDALETIAKFDEVRVIHPVNERALMTNVARRLLGLPLPVSQTPESISTQSSDSALDSSLLSRQYQGRDQLVCVADTGFDKGSTTDVHDAFTGRVKALHPWGRKMATDDPDGHGTHVCGCVLGRGQHDTEGQVDGTAPAANLMLQSFFSKHNYFGRSVLSGYPSDLGRLFVQAYEAGARIHSNSWGTPPSAKDGYKQRPYDAGAESIDRFVWDHQDMTVLFAAGNDGQDGGMNNRDGRVNERSLGAEASAKNCITVGASENLRPTLTSRAGASHGNKEKGKGAGESQPYTYGIFWPDKFSVNPLRDDHQADNPEGLAAFSSRGPTAENRLKPDVVAPGTAILSARSRSKKFVDGVDYTGVSGDDRYQYLSGTSMATPLVAGCCAVVREALLANGYRDKTAAASAAGNVNPTGALVKALLINGAVPIKGQYVPDDLGNGPNPHSGFVSFAFSLT